MNGDESSDWDAIGFPLPSRGGEGGLAEPTHGPVGTFLSSVLVL